MKVAIEIVRLHQVSRIDHVEVCYPTWMDPRELTATVISYDGSRLILDVDQHAYVRINKQDDLFFKVKNGTLELTTRPDRIGITDYPVSSLLGDYNRKVLDNLFPKAGVYDHSLLQDARNVFGRYFTSYLNTQLLFADRPEDEDYGDNITIAQGDYVYDVGHNTVYLPPEKMDEVNKIHKRLHVMYGFPHKPQHLTEILESFA